MEKKPRARDKTKKYGIMAWRTTSPTSNALKREKKALKKASNEGEKHDNNVRNNVNVTNNPSEQSEGQW